VTRDAIVALVQAHIDLAKTEAGAIAGAIGRLAALGAVAVGCVFLALFLVVVGSTLFLGEWLFGSIGWGVFHGFLLFIAAAMAAVLMGIGVTPGRIGRSLLVAVVVAMVLGVVLGLNLLNQAYAAIGERSGLASDPGLRPLVVGLVVGVIVGLVLGIVAAVTMVSSGGARVAMVVGWGLIGLVVGAFTAITFGPQVGAALGIAIGIVVWMVVMGIDVARSGIDLDSLKTRFYPAQTIDTSKETLEWLQKRMPPGIGS
jgi:hypothetical protein